jgi:hypothetical protein
MDETCQELSQGAAKETCSISDRRNMIEEGVQTLFAFSFNENSGQNIEIFSLGYAWR